MPDAKSQTSPPKKKKVVKKSPTPKKKQGGTKEEGKEEMAKTGIKGTSKGYATKDPINAYGQVKVFPFAPRIPDEETGRAGTGDRYTRYKGLVEPKTLQAQKCFIVGVGAAGHRLAIDLAAIGVGELTLVDKDTVQPENLGPQVYSEKHLKSPKVRAAREDCLFLNPHVKVNPLEQWMNEGGTAHSTLRTMPTALSAEQETLLPLATFVFACVDCMKSRANLFQSIVKRALVSKTFRPCFIDVRMGIEIIRVITITEPWKKEGYEYYRSTLFSNSEAFQQPCTAQATNYTSGIASGFMVANMVKTLRKPAVTPTRDFCISVLGDTMYVNPGGLESGSTPGIPPFADLKKQVSKP